MYGDYLANILATRMQAALETLRPAPAPAPGPSPRVVPTACAGFPSLTIAGMGGSGCERGTAERQVVGADPVLAIRRGRL